MTGKLSEPWARRAVIYAVSLVVTVLSGGFGIITVDQADGIIDALPSLITALSGIAVSVLALFNLHRGSDSTATSDDVEAARRQIPADVIPDIVDRVTDAVGDLVRGSGGVVADSVTPPQESDSTEVPAYPVPEPDPARTPGVYPGHGD